MNRYDFTNRRAVVTGGATGIGLGIAERLAAGGARIALWDRDPAALERARQRLGERTIAIELDVIDDAAVERAAKATEALLAGIDVLVCSAGITGPNATTWEYPLDAWRRVFDVNAHGLFYCNRAVVPIMRRSGYGRIVNIASVAGKEGNPNASAYSASKAAVIGLTKSLGKELAKTDIRVNCVTPAAVRTAIFEQMTRGTHRVHALEDPDGPLRQRRRGRRARLLACLRGMLVLDRCGIRRVGGEGDVLNPHCATRAALTFRWCYPRTRSMILPMCFDDSISAWACGASARSKVAWMVVFTSPRSSSGQTCSRNSPGELRLPFDRARAQRRSGDGKALQHDEAPIALDAAAFQEGDLRQAPFEGQAFQVLLDVVAADHVENHVDAALGGNRLDRFLEILRAVVDRVVGARLKAKRGLLG